MEASFLKKSTQLHEKTRLTIFPCILGVPYLQKFRIKLEWEHGYLHPKAVRSDHQSYNSILISCGIGRCEKQHVCVECGFYCNIWWWLALKVTLTNTNDIHIEKENRYKLSSSITQIAELSLSCRIIKYWPLCGLQPTPGPFFTNRDYL